YSKRPSSVNDRDVSMRICRRIKELIVHLRRFDKASASDDAKMATAKLKAFCVLSTAEDGAPTHWHLSFRDYLNVNYPRRWIGRQAALERALHHRPPRSPDLTPCEFFYR
ncbi:hypothetical protein J6590_104363, partial [Homalodisca vitripennis]